MKYKLQNFLCGIEKKEHKGFCKMVLSIFFCLLFCVSCSPAEQGDMGSFDKSIALYENDEYVVRECIRSDDALLALLIETRAEVSQEQGQGVFLDLLLYDRHTGDVFAPFSEPQVTLHQVSAVKGGGFQIQCASGNFFAGKVNGDWTLRGKNTPFGAGPQPHNISE